MKKRMEAAMREGKFSPQDMMAAIDQEKWYSLQSVPASTP
jgi:hypothetical protein